MNNVIKKNFAVRLNNLDKIEQLLQETYDLACQQYKTIQDEINKVANSTILKDLDIDGKEKYGKVMSNYITLQQKAIAQKFDIAKLMSEVLKSGGDVKKAIDETKKTTLNISELRRIAKAGLPTADEVNEVEEYTLKKP